MDLSDHWFGAVPQTHELGNVAQLVTVCADQILAGIPGTICVKPFPVPFSKFRSEIKSSTETAPYPRDTMTLIA